MYRKNLVGRGVSTKQKAQAKKGPSGFSSGILVAANITINSRKYSTLICEGSSQMELLGKVAKENGGGVVKLFYPKYGTYEIVGIKIGNDILVKGNPKALEKADYSDFNDLHSAKRFFVKLSHEAERNGGGGIHSFIRSGIPVTIDKKGNLMFPNFDETPVTRETNDVEIKREKSKADPRTVSDILNMYGRSERPSEILEKARSSHGGDRLEKIGDANNILLIDKDTGEISSPVFSNGKELSIHKNDDLFVKPQLIAPVQADFSTTPVFDGYKQESWGRRFHVRLFDGCGSTEELEEEGFVEFFFSPPASSGFSTVTPKPGKASEKRETVDCSCQQVPLQKIKIEKNYAKQQYNVRKKAHRDTPLKRKKTQSRKRMAGKKPVFKPPKKLRRAVFRYCRPSKPDAPAFDYGIRVAPVQTPETRQVKKEKKKIRKPRFRAGRTKKPKKRLLKKKRKSLKKKLRKLKLLVKKIKQLLKKIGKKKKSSEKPGKEVQDKRDKRNCHKRLHKLLMLYIKLKKSVTVKKRDRKKVDGPDNKVKGKRKAKKGVKEPEKTAGKAVKAGDAGKKHREKEKEEKYRTEEEIGG